MVKHIDRSYLRCVGVGVGGGGGGGGDSLISHGSFSLARDG